jgi:uncharacterized membrane protein
MTKMMTAAALATLIASSAFAQPTHHANRAYSAYGEVVAPNAAARNGDAAIQLEERKDAQSGYE